MILATESGFRKSFKKLIKKNPQLQPKILAVIVLLGDDPFAHFTPQDGFNRWLTEPY
jgi:mRNA-degrading endonuclease YafQ of YafQ-DinJ toxin-antitoxin module